MRYTPDGKTSLWWVPTISNKNAPTTAEINAGVNLTSYLAADGFDPGMSTNLVDAAGLDDLFDAQVQGTWAAKPKVTLFRDDTNDLAFNTLPRGTTGYWVLREKTTSSTAIAAGQKVHVFPSQVGAPMLASFSKNEMQKFSSEAAVTSAPVLNATVA